MIQKINNINDIITLMILMIIITGYILEIKCFASKCSFV